MDCTEKQRKSYSGIKFVRAYFVISLCWKHPDTPCYVVKTTDENNSKHVRSITRCFRLTKGRISSAAPLGIPTLVTSHWPFNDKTCQFQVFIIITLVGFSLIHTMVLMAVNRFYRIVKPTKYRHYFTNRKTLLMIFALWFYSIFAPLIGLLKRSKMIFHPFKLFCFFFYSKAVYLWPIVLLFSSNLCFCLLLLENLQNSSPSQRQFPSPRQFSKLGKRRRQW